MRDGRRVQAPLVGARDCASTCALSTRDGVDARDGAGAKYVGTDDAGTRDNGRLQVHCVGEMEHMPASCAQEMVQVQ